MRDRLPICTERIDLVSSAVGLSFRSAALLASHVVTDAAVAVAVDTVWRVIESSAVVCFVCLDGGEAVVPADDSDAIPAPYSLQYMTSADADGKELRYYSKQTTRKPPPRSLTDAVRSHIRRSVGR